MLHLKKNKTTQTLLAFIKALGHHTHLMCYAAVSFLRLYKVFCPIYLLDVLCLLKFKMQDYSYERCVSDRHSTSLLKILLLHVGEIRANSWCYLTSVSHQCKFINSYFCQTPVWDLWDQIRHTKMAFHFTELSEKLPVLKDVWFLQKWLLNPSDWNILSTCIFLTTVIIIIINISGNKD